MLANLLAYSASSMAESPPPTTARTSSRKIGSAASQTAHADTPPPLCASRSSFGSPSHFALAPVLTMTDRARYSSPFRVTSVYGRFSKSTFSTISIFDRVPNRVACSFIFSISSGPVTPSGKPG